MYEEIFKSKNTDFEGKYTITQKSVGIGIGIPELKSNGKYAIVERVFPVNTQIFFTGLYLFDYDREEILFYQIKYNNSDGYGFIYRSQLDNGDFGSNYVNNNSQGKAQNILDEIISYNQQILERNLLCARALELATENGIVLPVEYRKQLYTLQSRLSIRNEKIKQSGYVENVQEGTSPDFSDYNQSIVNFMNNPGIGFVITTTAVVIIVAVIIAATAGISYAIFKAMHTETKTDFNYSNDLTSELIKYLPEPVYKQLIQENEANAKKANEAIQAASGGSLMKNIKYLGLGVLGFIAVDKFVLSKK